MLDKKEEVKKIAVKYTVKFDKEKDDWVILKSDSERAIRRCKTKDEALKTAKTLSDNADIPLTVHKKNGQFQKKR